MKFEKTGPMRLPSRIAGGTFDLYLYKFDSEDRYFALKIGTFLAKEEITLRIESNCVWAHIFGSARCDCAEQLHEAMRRIAKRGKGLLIHAYDQDGRGITLEQHVRVYMEQDKGFDTVEADERCGLKVYDRRNYEEISIIMRDFNITNCRLLTNNPHRLQYLKSRGFSVVREAIEAVKLDQYNAAQIYTKKIKMNHMFSINVADQQVRELFQSSLKGGSSSAYTGAIWDC